MLMRTKYLLLTNLDLPIGNFSLKIPENPHFPGKSGKIGQNREIFSFWKKLSLYSLNNSKMNILSKSGLKLMIFDKVIALFVFWTFNRLQTVLLKGSLQNNDHEIESRDAIFTKFCQMCLIGCH